MASTLKSGDALMTGGIVSLISMAIQSSLPVVPSSALKNSLLPTSVKLVGKELPVPALISLTMTVPAEVPSLLQSSRPFTESLAAKKRTIL